MRRGKNKREKWQKEMKRGKKGSDKIGTFVSVFLPIISLGLIASVYFLGGGLTGYTILSANLSTRTMIDADVSFVTSDEEVLAPAAEIVVSIDSREARMTIADFIAKTGQEYSIGEGSLPAANFAGRGYTGNYTYVLNLSDFEINRTVAPGTHELKTRIEYLGTVLFEGSRSVTIQ